MKEKDDQVAVGLFTGPGCLGLCRRPGIQPEKTSFLCFSFPSSCPSFMSAAPVAPNPAPVSTPSSPGARDGVEGEIGLKTPERLCSLNKWHLYTVPITYVAGG